MSRCGARPQGPAPAAPTRWLAGRLAVVTGASRGIGAATAAALAAAGAHVVLAARDRRRSTASPAGSRTPAASHAGTDRCRATKRRSSACLPRPPGRPAGRAGLRGRGADVRAVRRDDVGHVGRDAGGQPDGHVPVLPRGVRAPWLPRVRAGSSLSPRCRASTPPRSSPGWRLQRLQVRGHRPDRGDRGRRQAAWHQRHLPEPGAVDTRCCAGPIPSFARA